MVVVASTIEVTSTLVTVLSLLWPLLTPCAFAEEEAAAVAATVTPTETETETAPVALAETATVLDSM